MTNLLGELIGKKVTVRLKGWGFVLTRPRDLEGNLLKADESGILLETPTPKGQTFIPIAEVLLVQAIG